MEKKSFLLTLFILSFVVFSIGLVSGRVLEKNNTSEFVQNMLYRKNFTEEYWDGQQLNFFIVEKMNGWDWKFSRGGTVAYNTNNTDYLLECKQWLNEKQQIRGCCRQTVVNWTSSNYSRYAPLAVPYDSCTPLEK